MHERWTPLLRRDRAVPLALVLVKFASAGVDAPVTSLHQRLVALISTVKLPSTCSVMCE